MFVKKLCALNHQRIEVVVDCLAFGLDLGLEEKSSFFPGDELVHAFGAFQAGTGGMSGLAVGKKYFGGSFFGVYLQASGHLGQSDGLQKSAYLDEGQVTV